MKYLDIQNHPFVVDKHTTLFVEDEFFDKMGEWSYSIPYYFIPTSRSLLRRYLESYTRDTIYLI